MQESLDDKVKQAISKRADLLKRTNVVRLVNGAPDGFKHIVVERQGNLYLVYVYDSQAINEARALAQYLSKQHPSVLWERLPRGKARLLSCFGEVPKAHIAYEEGARFLVRARDEKAVGTGVFADHRKGRRLVRAHARGLSVLNLFSHAGAFGVAAHAGSSGQITQVDAARKCATWASVNLALNGADPRKHRFFVEDAFAALKKAVKRKKEYGMVVIDPPTTAIRPGGKRFVTRDEVESMSEDCAQIIAPKGWLLFSLNDRSLSHAFVEQKVRSGLERHRRKLKKITRLSPESDFAEGDAPMRGIFAQVE